MLKQDNKDIELGYVEGLFNLLNLNWFYFDLSLIFSILFNSLSSINLNIFLYLK